MVAELRLHGVGHLADGLREGDFVELLDHLAVGELAEVAALRGRRTSRVRLRQLGELRREVGGGNLVELGLELLDLLERVGLRRRDLRVVGHDVVDHLLGLGLVVLRRSRLGLVLLDVLVDEDAVLELGAGAFLAKRELLEVLRYALGRVWHAGDGLEELRLALLAVGIRHRDARGLRVGHEDVLHYEALHELVRHHLACVSALLRRDLVALRLHHLLDIRVDRRLPQLDSVYRHRHGVVRLLLGVRTASGYHRGACEQHRAHCLDHHLTLCFHFVLQTIPRTVRRTSTAQSKWNL